MTMSFLAQVQQGSQLFDLVDSIDGELLGAVLILATIGFFVTSIVTVVTICSSITNIKVVKMHHRLVTELLQKGYSVDDIERLTVGQGIGGQVKALCRAATKRMKSSPQFDQPGSRLAPPVKQAV